MVKKNIFKGIIPPLSTIFKNNGEIDKTGMKKLIDELINKGVDGLLVLGSGGEFTQLSVEKRKEITEFCISHIDKRVPVIIGSGSTSTEESILLSKHAQNNGADGVIIINPYYWSLPEDNLINHFKQVSDSINIPIILYNFPDLTGQDLSSDIVLKIIENTENVVGIKETIDSVGHIREMITKVKNKYPEFKVFAGLDDHLLNTMQMGGDGAIPGSANFYPEITVNLYKAYQNKNWEELEELQKKLMRILTIYELGSPLYAAIKEAIKIRGRVDISSTVLPPALPISKENKQKIKDILIKENIV